MDASQIMERIEAIIADVQTAVLATDDKAGHLALRWMTPTLLKGRPETIYAITRRDTRKVNHLFVNAEAEWMFQTRALDAIIHVRGTTTPIDNPSLAAEILETLGPRLVTFWRVDPESEDLLALETVIREATILFPMKGERETVKVWRRRGHGQG